ncbi:MAG: hypothetical protein WCP20_16665 [Desulfuromonadales bacterium]
MKILYILLLNVSLLLLTSRVAYSLDLGGYPLEIIPSVTAGALVAQGNNPLFYWKAGLKLEGPVYKDLRFEAGAAYSAYRFSYSMLYKPDPTRYEKYLTARAGDESKIDYFGDLSYPVWKDFLRLDLRAGYRSIILDNNITSFEASGLHTGIGASKEFSFGTLDARGGVTTVFESSYKNLITDTTIVSVLAKSANYTLYGLPEFVMDYSLTYWLPKMAWAQIGFGFDGETVRFERTQRFFSGAAMAVKF